MSQVRPVALVLPRARSGVWARGSARRSVPGRFPRSAIQRGDVVMRSTEQVIAELARRQHSVLSGQQALDRGISRKVLRRRVASGQLTRLDHDTYHVAGTPVTWLTKLAAACLAAGGGAVVSHRSAAALWGLDGYRRASLDLTVPRGARLRRSDVMVHSSTDLDRCGIRTREGLRVTDPARTLLDLARFTPDAALLEAIECARRQGLTDWSELLATLAKHARRGRPGIRRFRRVIAANVHRSEPTDSHLELLFMALVLEHGLPEPILHHRLLDPSGGLVAEVDFAYLGLRIAIELDGSVHRQRDVFERDRYRQNRIVLSGWTILRFTWNDVVHRPEQVVAAVREAVRLASGAA